jgi:HD-GYP domain-containing protein (c-di-GMP phosphodiesterase class II)
MISSESAGRDRGIDAQANPFLTALAGAISQAQLYEPDNRILVGPMERLSTMLKDLLAHGSIFTFQGRDQSVFVNECRLRCDGPTFVRHQEFLKQLGLRRISGLTFCSELSLEEWRVLLFAVARGNRKSARVVEEMQARLTDNGIDPKVVLLPLVTPPAGGGDPSARAARSTLGGTTGPAPGSVSPGATLPGTVPGPGRGGSSQAAIVPEGGKKAAARKLKMNRRLFAARAYAKAILTFRDYVRNIEDPVRGGASYLRLQRSIFDLVAMCEEEGWRYLGLVHNKKFDDYLYNHSVNVTVLSLILGLRLQLNRPRLSELGMAAMLHHLGKARLPKELTEKQGHFNDAEKKLLASHSTLGVRELLKTKQYNESLLKRIMVMAEHHETHSLKGDTHPYSRIVAIAETFDALTTDRPYRPAYPPDAAVRFLCRLGGQRLDRQLTFAFVQSIGLYPAGTLVELSDQSIGVVFHPNGNPKGWNSPYVRLIRDGAYQEIPQAPVVDLSKPAAGGEPLAIVRTLDPGHLGINPAGYLFLPLPKGAAS